MAVNRTGISVGLPISSILRANQDISAITTNIFPVVDVTGEAELPYIAYGKRGSEVIPTKAKVGSEEVNIYLTCYAEDYGQAIDLAEAVRSAMDFKEYESDGLRLHASTYLSCADGWEDGAFTQELIFSIRINKI